MLLSRPEVQSRFSGPLFGKQYLVKSKTGMPLEPAVTFIHKARADVYPDTCRSATSNIVCNGPRLATVDSGMDTSIVGCSYC